MMLGTRVTDTEPRIWGLNLGRLVLHSRSTWADVSSNLFHTLQKQGCLAGVENVEVFEGIRKMGSGITANLPGVVKRGYRFFDANWYRSRRAFAERSRRATKMLKGRKDIDAVLQTSSMLLPDVDIPVFLYIDATLPQALDCAAHSASPVTLLSRRIIKQAVAIDRLVYSRADGIFTFSEWCRGSLLSDFNLPPHKVHVVGVGPSLPVIGIDTGIDDGQTVLFIGKDFERKGGPLLLEAFRMVKRKLPETRLIISGCSPEIEEEGVTVLGFLEGDSPHFIEKMLNLYRSATIFVMPSYYETFGIAYLEAMSLGVPCIALKRYAIPEFVIDGHTGLLIQKPEPEALASAMLFLLTQEHVRKRLGQTARQLALSRYTWDAVAQYIREIIAHVIRTTAQSS